MQRMRRKATSPSSSRCSFPPRSAGGAAPDAWNDSTGRAADASRHRCPAHLPACDIIVTCQGGDYDQGHVPEPARRRLERLLDRRCPGPAHEGRRRHHSRPGQPRRHRPARWPRAAATTSAATARSACMLMGVAGLFKDDLVEWMTCMTYQAASGRRRAAHARAAGADTARSIAWRRRLLDDPAAPSSTSTARSWPRVLRDDEIPVDNSGVPLAGSLIPWIDMDLGNGMSKEEWKGGAETNKILGRAGFERRRFRSSHLRAHRAMRCHCQALTIKLKRTVPLADIERMIAGANEWVKVVPNTRDAERPRADARRGDRQAARSRSDACANWRWARNTSARSPSAISCSGVRPNPCAACCGFSTPSPDPENSARPQAPGHPQPGAGTCATPRGPARRQECNNPRRGVVQPCGLPDIVAKAATAASASGAALGREHEVASVPNLSAGKNIS